MGATAELPQRAPRAVLGGVVADERGGKSFSKSPTAAADALSPRRRARRTSTFPSSFEEKTQRDADAELRMSLERASTSAGRGAATRPARPAAADEYQAPEQADWARARLLGPAAAKEARTRDDLACRATPRRASASQALAWRRAAAHLDTERLDRLEETLRQRIQPSSRRTAARRRAPRQFFAECDPARSPRPSTASSTSSAGQLLLPRRPRAPLEGSSPRSTGGSLERSAACRSRASTTCCAARRGRAGPSYSRASARASPSRAGLQPPHAARAVEEREADAAAGDSRGSQGLRVGGGAPRRRRHARRLADLAATPTDNAAIRDTFRPPADAAAAAAGAGDDVTGCSYAELLLALRGPPMNAARRALAARAAIRPRRRRERLGRRRRRPRRRGAPARLAERYDASKHRGVAGTLTEEEAAMASSRHGRPTATRGSRRPSCTSGTRISPLTRTRRLRRDDARRVAPRVRGVCGGRLSIRLR